MCEQKQSLTNQELEQTVGGESAIQRKQKARIYNKNNDRIGLRTDAGIEYYPCEKCGRPLHCGTFHRWYCDPCNCSYYDPDTKIWYGTEEQLKEYSVLPNPDFREVIF